MDHLRIDEVIEFSREKRIRKKLRRSEKIITEILCYEPGQSTPMHQHPEQDEIFYVVEGTGTITVGEEQERVAANSLYFVPAQTPHGLTADSRLVLLFFKAPGSTTPALKPVAEGSVSAGR